MNKKVIIFFVFLVALGISTMFFFWSKEHNRLPENVGYNSQAEAVEAIKELKIKTDGALATWQDFYVLGVSYIQVGNLGDAQILLEQALRKKDDFYKIYESLGMVYFRTEQFEKSVLTWQKILDFEENTGNLEMLIESAQKKKLLTDRVNELLVVIKANPDAKINWETKFELASLYLNLKNNSKVIEVTSDILKTKTDSHQIFDLLAEAYARSGDFENAIVNEKKALSLDKKNPDYKARLKSMEELLKVRGSGEFHLNADQEITPKPNGENK